MSSMDEKETLYIIKDFHFFRYYLIKIISMGIAPLLIFNYSKMKKNIVVIIHFNKYFIIAANQKSFQFIL